MLAARLSEDLDVRVLLLEAGPRDRTWKIAMPAALTYNLMDDRYNWYYQTEPQQHMDGRRLYWPRGRVLGGSSALNAMVYIRGHALDYDRWAKRGLCGLVLCRRAALFSKAETFSLGDDAYRGGDGPLPVSRGSSDNPLFDAWLRPGEEAGYPVDARHERGAAGGRRADGHDHPRRPALQHRAGLSAARPMGRPNLTVVTGALTTRIRVEGGRAAGVDYVENGVLKSVAGGAGGDRCGGAINSPQLLMLSGHRPGGPARRARGSGRCTTCRASAGTCRTISSCTCSRHARSR